MSKSDISKHPVVVFFILTIIISWGAVFLFFGKEGIPATRELQEQIGMAILPGPAAASLLLIILWDGINGLKQLWIRLIRWRADFRWYAVALLTAPLSTLVSIIAISFFIPDYQPAVFSSADKSSLLLLGLIGGLTIGLFEEIGWTGFAIPRLLKKIQHFYDWNHCRSSLGSMAFYFVLGRRQF